MRLAVLLGAALLLRIGVALAPGFAGDRVVFATWAQTLATSGPLAIYGPGVDPTVDYPPGYLYVLWAVGLVHGLFGGALAWKALLEVVPITADLVLVALLYGIALRITTRGRALAFAAIAAFAPPLWLDSATWGQADSIPIVLALVALCAALETRAVAWPALCAAILVKPLAIAIAPLLAVLQLRSRPPWGGLALAGVASLALAYVSTLPFTTARAPVAVLRFLFDRYAIGASKAPFVTVGAFDLYPLIAGFQTRDDARIGPLSYHALGIALVSIAIAAIAIAFARAPLAQVSERARLTRTLGAASLSLLALFLFATRMHERYLLPGLVVGAPLALEDRPTALAIGWLALAFTINCAYSLAGFGDGAHHPFVAVVGRAIAAGNLIAFVVLWQRQTRRLAAA